MRMKFSCCFKNMDRLGLWYLVTLYIFGRKKTTSYFQYHSGGQEADKLWKANKRQNSAKLPLVVKVLKKILYWVRKAKLW